MNISATNIILHSLNYSAEGVLECTKRDGELPISPSIEQFLTKIHSTYQSKTNKAFASFRPVNDKPQVFQQALESQMAGELDFVSFSQTAVDCLVEELQKQDFAEQGILLISKYSWTASDYLLIALLPNNESISVNENLELTSSQYLETSKIQLVTRIDLTLLARSPDSNRYLSFIKGRVGRQVSDFFLDFMGAQEGFDAKVQNQVLMKAVEEFCEKEALPIDQKQQVREAAFDYCKEQIKQGADIELSTLSEQLQETPKLEGSFYDFVSEDYQLEQNFPADRSVMRKLTKYVGQGGGISISFDQKHLGDRIQYDADSDTLTIKGIPPNLREQLKRDAITVTSNSVSNDEDAPF
ncbi:MAG: nucleoid-associated protein YejK [Psychromonas sp.]